MSFTLGIDTAVGGSLYIQSHRTFCSPASGHRWKTPAWCVRRSVPSVTMTFLFQAVLQNTRVWEDSKKVVKKRQYVLGFFAYGVEEGSGSWKVWAEVRGVPEAEVWGSWRFEAVCKILQGVLRFWKVRQCLGSLCMAGRGFRKGFGSFDIRKFRKVWTKVLEGWGQGSAGIWKVLTDGNPLFLRFFLINNLVLLCKPLQDSSGSWKNAL